MTALFFWFKILNILKKEISQLEHRTTVNLRGQLMSHYTYTIKHGNFVFIHTYKHAEGR